MPQVRILSLGPCGVSLKDLKSSFDDTPHFLLRKSLYRDLGWGVADCYAFSCFHDNVGLWNLPAVRHFKSADAVVEDHDPLIGNAALLDRWISVNVVDQLPDHAPCNRGSVRIAPDGFKKEINIHFLAVSLFQFQPQGLDLSSGLALFLFIPFCHFSKLGIVNLGPRVPELPLPRWSIRDRSRGHPARGPR